MEFEVLKRNHGKRNIIIGVGAVLIISAIVFNLSSAKYRVSDSVPLINGTINYTPYDFKVMAIYRQNDTGEYEEIEAMPSNGYIINEEKSYCTIDNVNKDESAILYTDDRGQHVFSGLKKSSKCYLYFDEGKIVTSGEQILENYTTKLIRNDFSTIDTETTTGIIYYADTSNGRTYYFAGNPTDNWVNFAGFYWRIIRINEDESIRLIYAGTSTSISNMNTDDQIQESSFNDLYRDNMYVGYMYQNGEVHGLQNDSTIKEVLDTWYENNLQDNYAQYLSTEAGFCGDRTSTTTDGGATNDTGGTGITETYYGARYRLYTNKKPSFECADSENDLYTLENASVGNKALDYPIGLITADEVAYAGGVYNLSNSSYYLYSGSNYWTMSPSYIYTSGNALVFFVHSTGYSYEWNVHNTLGTRPVINLASNVTITGSGTATDPYQLSVG